MTALVRVREDYSDFYGQEESTVQVIASTNRFPARA
jgi:hypothetical protein